MESVTGTAAPPIAWSALSRRRFLSRLGLVVVGTAVAPAFANFQPVAAAEHGEGHHEAALPVWAATRGPQGYFALAAPGDVRGVHELYQEGSDVRLGTRLAADIPAALLPQALYANGNQLLLAGGAYYEAGSVVLDYDVEDIYPDDLADLPPELPAGVHEVPIISVRPTLHEVGEEGLTEIPLGDVTWPFAVAHAVVTPEPGHMSILIGGSADIEAAYGEQVGVLSTRDGGATWQFDVLAAGLGEGHHGALVSRATDLYVITVDQNLGRRTFEGLPGMWQEGGGGNDEDPAEVLAAIGRADGTVDVFTRDPSRQAVLAGGHEPVPLPYDTAVDVIAVSGTDEVLVVGMHSMRIAG